MNSEHRAVEQCQFWQPTAGGDPSQCGSCRLLQQITGVADAELCEVVRDACLACRRSFPPSADDLNPVVASVLHQVTLTIIERNGTAGCDVKKARELNSRAEDSIPILPPDEDDVGVPATKSILRTPRSPEESIESLLPLPERRSGPPVLKWAVGITTAPRRLETLDDCITSVLQSGWEMPHLFVDSPVPIPEQFSRLPTTVRNPKVGAFPNYYLTLAELLLGDPDADAYLLIQDDVLFFNHPRLREYLERAFWPGDRPGLVSLFCSRAYTQPQAGWSKLGSRWTWGAQAFVFPRATAQAFIADHRVLMHRWNPKYKKLANIDSLIGEWAERNRVPVYFPTPSLVQHIGHVSTLWPNVRAAGGRRADRFAGEESPDPNLHL